MTGDRARLRDLLRWLEARSDEQASLIEALARCESPSGDPGALRNMLDLLRRALCDRGWRVRLVAGRATGGHLLAAPPIDGVTGGTTGGARRPCQLLLGHCDTVWPLGTLSTMPVERREGRLFGPGVFDMKAGLVQAMFALDALRAAGLEPRLPPVLLINTDEEIGSPESTRAIRRLARGADRALVLEPSLGPAGKLKTARKGVGRFTVRVVGRAAHAGLDPERGISAILELSHVVQRLFALNSPERGVSVNVGTIDGGLRPNVVAPEARAECDVRVLTQGDAEEIEAAILGMRPITPGTELRITGRIGRPPLERTPGNRRLWERACSLAGELGVSLEEGTAGGGSDGNTTSLFTPTLDGLGAVGDGAHAVDEHVVLERLPERTALLAALLASPPVRDAELSHAAAPAQAVAETAATARPPGAA